MAGVFPKIFIARFWIKSPKLNGRFSASVTGGVKIARFVNASVCPS